MLTNKAIVEAIDKVVRDAEQAKQAILAGEEVRLFGPARELSDLDDKMVLRAIKAAVPKLDRFELDTESEYCDDGTYALCLSSVELCAGDATCTLYDPECGDQDELEAVAKFLGVGEETAEEAAGRIWLFCQDLVSDHHDGIFDLKEAA